MTSGPILEVKTLMVIIKCTILVVVVVVIVVGVTTVNKTDDFIPFRDTIFENVYTVSSKRFYQSY